MQCLVIATATHRTVAHAALADNQTHARLLDECFLEFLHAHRSRRTYRHHLICVLAEWADNRAGMQDGSVLDINRQLAPLLDDAAMCHIAAGRKLSRQVNDIPDIDIFKILCADWRRQYFLSHQKSTSECESIV